MQYSLILKSKSSESNADWTRGFSCLGLGTGYRWTEYVIPLKIHPIYIYHACVDNASQKCQCSRLAPRANISGIVWCTVASPFTSSSAPRYFISIIVEEKRLGV
jgi:hypothetical protein